MKIIPPSTSIQIDPNWQATYQLSDDPVSQRVRITIPAKSPITANPSATPPVAAQPACQQFSFVLWGTNTATTYAQAQAMNNGLGYGNADLIAAITTYLNAIVTPGA